MYLRQTVIIVVSKAIFRLFCVVAVNHAAISHMLIVLKLIKTRWVALMIQFGKFVGGWGVGWCGGVGWLTSTTYIQLAGAGSMKTV